MMQSSLITSLLVLQPWVSLGLLNNLPPFLSCIVSIHCFILIAKVCYHIVHPSQTRSSFSSSYKQSSFHCLSWHCSHFHSLYMSHPSYSLSFYKFHNILSIYGSVQFFIISNSPDRPIGLLQYFPFENS